MGKIRQGILGGFSGKVGPVIGSSWKGKAVMRSIALSYNDANTQAQQEVRARFSLLGKFLANINGFIGVGFAKQAVGMTAPNAAMQINYDTAVTGTWPNLSIAYNNTLVSYGKVDLPFNPSASIDSGSLQVSWSDNSGLGDAEANDNVMLLLYNPAKNQAVYTTEAAVRSDRNASFTVPTAWTGDAAETYLAMRRAKSGETSKSFYLGSLTI